MLGEELANIAEFYCEEFLFALRIGEKEKGCIKMVKFEDAYEVAKELKSSVETCTEYETAFVFWYDGTEDDYNGKEYAPIVISKKNGKAIPMGDFVADGPGKMLGDIRFELIGNDLHVKE